MKKPNFAKLCLRIQLWWQIKKDLRMSRQVMDITIREQLKSIRLRRRRKELGIEDLPVGVVYDGQRFNAGHRYYGLHLIRRMPDAALEYLYDQALEGKGDLDSKVLEFYVAELRYRAERRTARRALFTAVVATVASLLALGIALYATVLLDRTETPPLPSQPTAVIRQNLFVSSLLMRMDESGDNYHRADAGSHGAHRANRRKPAPTVSSKTSEDRRIV